MQLKRRDFLQVTGAGLLAGAAISGCEGEKPAATAALNPPASAPAVSILGHMRATVERLGDALVPGAAQAGIAGYLESQLGAKPENALLMLRYLGVPAPYRDFYMVALEAVENWSQARFSASVSQLSSEQLAQLVQDLAANKPGDWGAPAAAFFYFVLRADACDVVYGTRAGFARLGIPYMAHIEPAQDW